MDTGTEGPSVAADAELPLDDPETVAHLDDVDPEATAGIGDRDPETLADDRADVGALDGAGEPVEMLEGR
jgi:hypothetical protein